MPGLQYAFADSEKVEADLEWDYIYDVTSWKNAYGAENSVLKMYYEDYPAEDRSCWGQAATFNDRVYTAKICNDLNCETSEDVTLTTTWGDTYQIINDGNKSYKLVLNATVWEDDIYELYEDVAGPNTCTIPEGAPEGAEFPSGWDDPEVCEYRVLFPSTDGKCLDKVPEWAPEGAYVPNWAQNLDWESNTDWPTWDGKCLYKAAAVPPSSEPTPSGKYVKLLSYSYPGCSVSWDIWYSKATGAWAAVHFPYAYNWRVSASYDGVEGSVYVDDGHARDIKAWKYFIFRIPAAFGAWLGVSDFDTTKLKIELYYECEEWQHRNGTACVDNEAQIDDHGYVEADTASTEITIWDSENSTPITNVTLETTALASAEEVGTFLENTSIENQDLSNAGIDRNNIVWWIDLTFKESWTEIENSVKFNKAILVKIPVFWNKAVKIWIRHHGENFWVSGLSTVATDCEWWVAVTASNRYKWWLLTPNNGFVEIYTCEASELLATDADAVAAIWNDWYATIAEAIAAGDEWDTVEILKAWTYGLPSINKAITIKWNADWVVFKQAAPAANWWRSISEISANVTFENVTFDLLEWQEGGQYFRHYFTQTDWAVITMSGCKINWLLTTMWDMNFNNCNFYQNTNLYNIRTSLWNINFSGWTIENSNGYGYVTAHNQEWGLEKYTVTFNGTQFINGSQITWKSAINVKEVKQWDKVNGNVWYAILKYNVIIDNVTTEWNFPTNKLWGSKIFMVDDIIGSWLYEDGSAIEVVRANVDSQSYGTKNGWEITITLDWDVVYSTPKYDCAEDGHHHTASNGVCVEDEVEYQAQIWSQLYETIAEAIVAAQEWDIVKVLKSWTYKLPNLPVNITIKWEVDGVVFEHDANDSYNIANIPNWATFEGVKFSLIEPTTSWKDPYYHGFGYWNIDSTTSKHNSAPIVMNNCVIEWELTSYWDMQFNRCTFNIPENQKYWNVWTWFGDITFDNCTFNWYDRNIHVHNTDGSKRWNITVKDSTFSKRVSSAKSALVIKESHGHPNETDWRSLQYNVTILNPTLNTENYYTATYLWNKYYMIDYQIDGWNENWSYAVHEDPLTIWRWTVEWRNIVVKLGENWNEAEEVYATPQIKYTVTFNLNGHGEENGPTALEVAHGSKITDPNYNEEVLWYTFGGWYKEATCENIWNFESDTVSADTVLYAKWTGKDVIITVDWENDGQAHHYGDIYTLPTNHIQKPNDTATVTFKYNDNITADTTSTVTKTYTPNGWTIGETHYANEAEITLTDNVTLVPDYTEEVTAAVLPTPTRDHYDFDGWYNGQTKYESYNTVADIELTAKWVGEAVTVNGEAWHNYWEEYALWTNNGTKEPTEHATVTFIYDNGAENTTSKVTKTYTPNGWLVNWAHKENGETITLEWNTTIEPNYTPTTVSATFPNPEKEHYTFNGWYNGEIKYTNYTGDNDIELTAKWTGDPITITINDAPDWLEHHYGDTYTLPVIPTKNSETKTVTFKYNDDMTPDGNATVTKTYTPAGWKVNEQIYQGASIELTGDITLTPNYTESITPAVFPQNPTREHYTFSGWFNGETKYTEYNTFDDIILTAKWDIDTFTVTWMNGETQLQKDENVSRWSTPTFNWTAAPTKPETSSYTYSFKWWSRDNKTIVDLTSEQITENTTYYALFTETAKQTSNWWWGGGWWGGGSSSSYSCKNLPSNATANNTDKPKANTNYSYSTDTKAVCTFQCNSGFTWNATNSKCEKSETQATTWDTALTNTWNTTTLDNSLVQENEWSTSTDSNSQEILENGFTKEFNNAYEFAFRNGITTMPDIQNAHMYGELNRIAMAKMLSNYGMNILWKKPANVVVPEFTDVSSELNEQYGNAVTLAYQLGIMWINMPNNEFRPFDTVTRAEFGTALSRLLFGLADWVDAYYTTHLAKLKAEWIITNDDPTLQELRWYVMIMLMRAAK